MNEFKVSLLKAFNAYVDLHILVSRSGRFMMKVYLKNFFTNIYKCLEIDKTDIPFRLSILDLLTERFSQIRALNYRDYSGMFFSEYIRVLDTCFSDLNKNFSSSNMELLIKKRILLNFSKKDQKMVEFFSEWSTKLEDFERLLDKLRETFSDVFPEVISILFVLKNSQTSNPEISKIDSDSIISLKAPEGCFFIYF